jgi:hypothetical protein
MPAPLDPAAATTPSAIRRAPTEPIPALYDALASREKAALTAMRSQLSAD